MSNEQQREKITNGQGFIAALDQSGGSTPKALKQYGIEETAFKNDAEMFALVHEMRARIITAPPFNGDKIIGAILFEKTMDGKIKGMPTAQYLWEKLQIVPFLKIDQGLDTEKDGSQIMKSIPGLDKLLDRASQAGIFGTKMRSVIKQASQAGITAVVKQQFEFAEQIMDHGLVPIIEPEVDIKAADKAECEKILKNEILKCLDALPEDRQVMLKLTIPDQAGFYNELVNHERVMRVVALSGGYELDDACNRLAQNEGMIASFSRALTNGLKVSQSDKDFNYALQSVIDKIFTASVKKNIARTQAA